MHTSSENFYYSEFELELLSAFSKITIPHYLEWQKDDFKREMRNCVKLIKSILAELETSKSHLSETTLVQLESKLHSLCEQYEMQLVEITHDKDKKNQAKDKLEIMRSVASPFFLQLKEAKIRERYQAAMQSRKEFKLPWHQSIRYEIRDLFKLVQSTFRRNN